MCRAATCSTKLFWKKMDWQVTVAWGSWRTTLVVMKGAVRLPSSGYEMERYNEKANKITGGRE